MFASWAGRTVISLNVAAARSTRPITVKVERHAPQERYFTVNYRLPATLGMTYRAD
jgi:hypothetical protein